jgi:phage baseplate assembly protein W
MSSVLSDFNATGVRSSNVAIRRTYVDLDLRLAINPFTKDISVLTDIDAVRASVKKLVLTNFYERPFQPFLGGNITGTLFENVGPVTVIALRNEIFRVLAEEESRINRVRVDVTDDSDRNALRVNITFNIAAINTESEINFFLNRLR